MTVVESRLLELDAKFDRLYDDRLEGFILDKKFKEMAVKCEREQEQLNVRLIEIQEQLSQQTEIEVNVSRFVETVRRYTNIETLDRVLLNRLIDKINVTDKVKTDTGYTKKVKIYYRFLSEMYEDCFPK